ncbi:hypothetical protein ACFXB4_13960 [Streptomyces lavendulae]|uniref:hypothetical protein n=1 Tax=Streptomyces lavendulae TaxID=1914 RepID=UPI0036D15DC4
MIARQLSAASKNGGADRSRLFGGTLFWVGKAWLLDSRSAQVCRAVSFAEVPAALVGGDRAAVFRSVYQQDLHDRAP